MHAERPFDIVVWGATGFSGGLVVDYLSKHAPSNIRWTIAGRNRHKLQIIQAEFLVADSADMDSLVAMCQKTRLIISTVGPYALHGRLLVQACVENQVDYLDITGEMPFVQENTKYHDACKENGTMIISCCGFDCLPSDMGVYMLVQQAQQTYQRHVTEVKGCVHAVRVGVSGGSVNTILYSAEHEDHQESDVWRGVHHDADFQSVQGFNPVSIGNMALVHMSAYLQQDAYGSTFSYTETASYPNTIVAWLMSSFYRLFMASVHYSWVRWLIGKTLPSPGQGPSMQDMLTGCLEMRFVATMEPKDTDEHPLPKLKASFKLNLDPAYAGTALMMSTVALTIAQRRDELPGKTGGVLTPATALGSVLVEELRLAGVHLVASQDAW
jgi:short subunit dehydrogenase-like uncharacterized protein